MTFRTKPERFVGDELISRETVVQLDDVDGRRVQARRLEALLGSEARHVISDLKRKKIY